MVCNTSPEANAEGIDPPSRRSTRACWLKSAIPKSSDAGLGVKKSSARLPRNRLKLSRAEPGRAGRRDEILEEHVRAGALAVGHRGVQPAGRGGDRVAVNRAGGPALNEERAVATEAVLRLQPAKPRLEPAVDDQLTRTSLAVGRDQQQPEPQISDRPILPFLIETLMDRFSRYAAMDELE